MICRHFKHSPVYRIGGDEFVAFIEGEDFTSREQLICDFNKDNLIVSCGFSEYRPKSDKNYHKIFERADKKMYEHKIQVKKIIKQ